MDYWKQVGIYWINRKLLSCKSKSLYFLFRPRAREVDKNY